MSLDGTNNTYVDTSLVGGINQAGSMVGWFNLATLPSTAGRYFSIAGESQSGNDFDLQIQNNNQLYFYTNSGGAAVDPTAFTVSNLNQWVFVAATFTSGGNATLYVNDAQVAQTGAGTHGNGTGTFAIGASDVYNTELTAGQVGAIYKSANIVPEPSTWAVALLGLGAGGLGLTLRRHARRTWRKAAMCSDGVCVTGRVASAPACASFNDNTGPTATGTLADPVSA